MGYKLDEAGQFVQAITTAARDAGQMEMTLVNGIPLMRHNLRGGLFEWHATVNEVYVSVIHAGPVTPRGILTEWEPAVTSDDTVDETVLYVYRYRGAELLDQDGRRVAWNCVREIGWADDRVA